MVLLPFLLFILLCLAIVAAVIGLFHLLMYFGRSEADELREISCPQCGTKRKPHKTGVVRNLVELEMRCSQCGYISWDIPPKTNLSSRPSSDPSKGPPLDSQF